MCARDCVSDATQTRGGRAGERERRVGEKARECEALAEALERECARSKRLENELMSLKAMYRQCKGAWTMQKQIAVKELAMDSCEGITIADFRNPTSR